MAMVGIWREMGGARYCSNTGSSASLALSSKFLTAKSSGARSHLGTFTASVRFDEFEFRGPRPVAWDKKKLMLTGNDTLICNVDSCKYHFVIQFFLISCTYSP